MSVGFFERNRRALVEQGYDPSRLPPGQYLTQRFPVLHVGDVPSYEPGEWDLTIRGLVDEPFTLESRRAARPAERHADVRHPLRDEVEPVRHDVDGRARPRPVRAGGRAAVGDARDRARRVRLHDERPARRHHHRRRDRRLRATTARRSSRSTAARCASSSPTCTSGRAPSGCASSSSVAGDRPGFWEQNGYHMYGDPFREQRYTNDSDVQSSSGQPNQPATSTMMWASENVQILMRPSTETPVITTFGTVWLET